jgi:predicted ATPase
VTGIGCPEVVGRDAELAALVDALDALDDRGRLVAVQGEAGIGKTRLASELQTAAGDRGVRVLSGRAVETDTPVPYRALFEALAGHFRKVDSADEVGLRAFRPALAQLVPQWRLPDGQLYRASSVELAEALLRLLSRIGDEQGCVLILEDLHWADPDTAAVLEYVGDNIVSLPVLCLVTLRTDNTSPTERVVRALQSRRHADVLDLHRLDSAHVTEIAQLCLGTTALPAGVEALVRRFSDGLPFLVEELLASAVGDGSSGSARTAGRPGPRRTSSCPSGSPTSCDGAWSRCPPTRRTW